MKAKWLLVFLCLSVGVKAQKIRGLVLQKSNFSIIHNESVSYINDASFDVVRSNIARFFQEKPSFLSFDPNAFSAPIVFVAIAPGSQPGINNRLIGFSRTYLTKLNKVADLNMPAQELLGMITAHACAYLIAPEYLENDRPAVKALYADYMGGAYLYFVIGSTISSAALLSRFNKYLQNFNPDVDPDSKKFADLLIHRLQALQSGYQAAAKLQVQGQLNVAALSHDYFSTEN